MSWPTSFHTSIFHWFQSHPIVATFCLLIILYNVHSWLYPDPIMKLPVAPGGSLIGGHSLLVVEWVAQLFLERFIDFITVSSARRSPTLHEKYVRELGRNIRLRGFHPVRRCPNLHFSRQVTYHSSSGNTDFSHWTRSH